MITTSQYNVTQRNVARFDMSSYFKLNSKFLSEITNFWALVQSKQYVTRLQTDYVEELGDKNLMVLNTKYSV